MEVNFSLTFDPSNQIHVDFLKWKQTSENQATVNALILGYLITNNELLANYNNRDVTDALSQLTQEHAKSMNAIKQQHEQYVQSIRSQHASDIESYRKKISDQYDEWIIKFEKLSETYNQSLKHELNNYKDKEIESLKCQLSVVQNTNSFKGEQGEQNIRDILRRNFIGYEIADTSAQGGMSDIHLFDKTNSLVAIECKNKSAISTTDVTKSLQDIKNLKAKFPNSFTGYFFVSMRSPNIPKKGDIFYEIIDDIPVIWYGCSNPITLEQDVVNFIKLLYCHKIRAPQKEETIISAINEHIKKVSEVKKQIDSVVNSMHTMQNSMLTIKATIDWLFQDMYKLLGDPVTTSTHQCPHCHIEYKRKGDLQKHINSKHSNPGGSDTMDTL